MFVLYALLLDFLTDKKLREKKKKSLSTVELIYACLKLLLYIVLQCYYHFGPLRACLKLCLKIELLKSK